MKKNVKAIPDGYHAVTPYLIVKGASNAIEFYVKAFGATEMLRMPDEKGIVRHAEIRIGDSVVMLADEHPEIGAVSPSTLGGSPVSVLLYVEDVDVVFNQAVAAGAEVLQPVTVQFYGDRRGGVKDPYGYSWYIATRVEDLTPDELEMRAKAQGS